MLYMYTDNLMLPTSVYVMTCLKIPLASWNICHLFFTAMLHLLTNTCVMWLFSDVEVEQASDRMDNVFEWTIGLWRNSFKEVNWGIWVIE